jgi:mono/diheme cytochrome c family protein
MRRSGAGLAVGVLAVGILAAGVLAAPPPAFAQSPDVDAGRVLAERWCSGCHLIDTQQAEGNDGAPTFRVIGRKEWTDLKFSMAMASPHPPMPSLDLTRQELANLLAFVRSQAQ